MWLPVSGDSHRYCTQFRLASILSFAAACVLLYFGTGMLLVVPGYPGEGYFVAKRIIYGFLPSVCSGALLVAVGWLWGPFEQFRKLLEICEEVVPVCDGNSLPLLARVDDHSGLPPGLRAARCPEQF